MGYHARFRSGMNGPGAYTLRRRLKALESRAEEAMRRSHAHASVGEFSEAMDAEHDADDALAEADDVRDALREMRN